MSWPSSKVTPNRFYSRVTTTFILFLMIFLFPIFSQAETVDELKQEAIRIEQLLNWDSTFSIQLNESLVRVNDEIQSSEQKEIILSRLLTHYQAIKQNNKSRVKLDFEESIFNWMAPMGKYLTDPSANSEKIIKGFPDTYFPAKILAPELLTDSALYELADKYPKEVMYTVRFTINANALKEVERAAANAPNEAKGYLHYSNNVNTLLKESQNPYVLKLFEIYRTYKYGSKSFYLLDLIFKDEMTMQEAHAISKDREKFYNALVSVYKRDDAIGLQSVEEKLAEFSGKYMRKLIFQRHLSSSQLKLDALDELRRDAKIYLLFSMQGSLKKKDLQNVTKLYKKKKVIIIDEASANWIPVEWIGQLEARLDEEKIRSYFDQLIKHDLWAFARKSNISYTPVSEQIVEAVPVPVIEILFKAFPTYFSNDDKELIKFENNPYESLKDISKLTGKLYSRKMLLMLAVEHPVEVMAQLDKFMYQPYAYDVCRALAKSAPLTVKNYIVKKDHKIHSFLKPSSDEAIKTIYQIDSVLGNWTRAYILLDAIVNKELTPKEANEICKEKHLLLPHLIKTFLKDEYLGVYTVEKELEYRALDFVRNYNISENTDKSYQAELNKLDAQTLFTFMIFGEQEIINRTFLHMYERLSVITAHNLSNLFKLTDYKYADQFVRMAIHNGKEYDLFSKLDPSTSNELLQAIFAKLEQNNKGDVHGATDAADIIIGLRDQGRLIQIQKIIKNAYERLGEANNSEGITTYGILASILSQRIRETWSAQAAAHYQIPNLISIPVYTLFNEDLINIQQYYFYDDRDGLYSYRNFVRQYEKSSYNWEIEDLRTYVKISSKTGKAVEIYANKPTEGDDGILNLENYLKSNKLYPQIVVHRGLSTHTLKTFRKIPSSAKLILDGSCGGFHIQGVALENAPGAHILCNRNIGTMHINDPMFKQISESIRQGKDIVWPSFWSEMEARLGTNPYFKDYIPPHKNVGALILKAYYDVLGINN